MKSVRWHAVPEREVNVTPSSLVLIVNCDVATVFNYSTETDYDVHSALQR